MQKGFFFLSPLFLFNQQCRINPFFFFPPPCKYQHRASKWNPAALQSEQGCIVCTKIEQSAVRGKGIWQGEVLPWICSREMVLKQIKVHRCSQSPGGFPCPELIHSPSLSSLAFPGFYLTLPIPSLSPSPWSRGFPSCPHVGRENRNTKKLLIFPRLPPVFACSWLLPINAWFCCPIRGVIRKLESI